MPSNKQPKYAPGLQTVEIRIPGPSGQTLMFHHQFGALPEAMEVIQVLRTGLKGTGAKIWLWHKHQLAGTFSPYIEPGPKALPPPGPDGIRRAPPTTRKISQFRFHDSPEKLGL